MQQYDYKEAHRTSQIPPKQLAKVVYNYLIMQKRVIRQRMSEHSLLQALADVWKVCFEKLRGNVA